jgi:hypothetical protein
MIPPYLAEVFVRSKLALSGGVVIVAVVFIEWVTGQSLPRSWHIAAITVAIIGAQFWHGLAQFGKMHPPFLIVYPKQQFWNETALRGTTGMGYWFDVLNPSETESLESVRAQLVAIEPPDVGNLPIPLHIRHKSYASNETEISVPPNGVAGFDIATGPDHNENSQKQAVIPCVMAGDRGVVKSVPISDNRHRLTIRVTTTRHFKDIEFEVWVGDNFLRCEPVQTFVMEVL